MTFQILTTAISAVILGVLTSTSKLLFAEIKKNKITQNALKNILKSEIVDKHNQAVKQNYITDLQLDIIHRLNSSYKELGGNSYIKSLIKNVDELPVQKGF